MTYATRAVHLELSERAVCNGQSVRGTMQTTKIKREVTCKSCLRALNSSLAHQEYRRKFVGD